MIKLNFNNAPCGKTYYEMYSSWKYLKMLIKKELDPKSSSKIEKLNSIISYCEVYKNTYLIIKKGSEKNV